MTAAEAVRCVSDALDAHRRVVIADLLQHDALDADSLQALIDLYDSGAATALSQARDVIMRVAS